MWNAHPRRAWHDTSKDHLRHSLKKVADERNDIEVPARICRTNAILKIMPHASMPTDVMKRAFRVAMSAMPWNDCKYFANCWWPLKRAPMGMAGVPMHPISIHGIVTISISADVHRKTNVGHPPLARH